LIPLLHLGAVSGPICPEKTAGPTSPLQEDDEQPGPKHILSLELLYVTVHKN